MAVKNSKNRSTVEVMNFGGLFFIDHSVGMQNRSNRSKYSCVPGIILSPVTIRVVRVWRNEFYNDSGYASIIKNYRPNQSCRSLGGWPQIKILGDIFSPLPPPQKIKTYCVGKQSQLWMTNRLNRTTRENIIRLLIVLICALFRAKRVT